MIAIIKEQCMIAKKGRPVSMVIEGEVFRYNVEHVSLEDLQDYMMNKSCLVGSEYFKYTDEVKGTLVDVLTFTKVGDDPVTLTAPLVTLEVKNNQGKRIDSIECVVYQKR